MGFEDVAFEASPKCLALHKGFLFGLLGFNGFHITPQEYTEVGISYTSSSYALLSYLESCCSC